MNNQPSVMSASCVMSSMHDVKYSSIQSILSEWGSCDNSQSYTAALLPKQILVLCEVIEIQITFNWNLS